MKIVTIVGARPQFIKLAPFSKKIREKYTEIIIHTGQHYNKNMSDDFFRDLEIPFPDYNLEVGSDSQAKQTAKMLIGLEELLIKINPKLVVVFGDTNSTIAGALAAVKLNLPVAHIEAGLRSFNKNMPEEINRIVTDHCSDFLFVPTNAAMQNLHKEGLGTKSFLTGDIMVDALKNNIKKAESSTILNKFNLQPEKFFLLTLHRPYNVDNFDAIFAIFEVLNKIQFQIVFPVHPRTKKMLESFRLDIPPNIILIDPVGYLDFIWLEKNSKKIITDSGGIQKEAYILKKPCITIRPETEWIETVETGWNQLVGTDKEQIINAINNNNYFLDKMSPIFGDGHCSEKILDIISSIIS